MTEIDAERLQIVEFAEEPSCEHHHSLPALYRINHGDSMVHGDLTKPENFLASFALVLVGSLLDFSQCLPIPNRTTEGLPK
jgi:hypothetical protein